MAISVGTLVTVTLCFLIKPMSLRARLKKKRCLKLKLPIRLADNSSLIIVLDRTDFHFNVSGCPFFKSVINSA